MKVGGPLRGYTRAFRISLGYCIRYFVLGAVLILAVGVPLIDWDTVGVLLIHFVVSLVMFPTVLAANVLFARIFSFRSWRNERWREWVASVLGVVLTAGGMVLLTLISPRQPRFLRDFPGPTGPLLYAQGWLVLFSNLALLIAWALPSRKG